MKLALALTVVFGTLLLVGSGARAEGAEPDFEAAARAYREGQAAQNGAKPAEAARWYELADSIAPSPQALRNAIRSHLAAAQGPRAATLALVAQRRYSDRETRSLAREVLAGSGAALARITVKCGVPCELLCDGQALTARPESEFDVYIQPGNHAVSARFDAREAVQQQVELGAGERLILNLESSAPVRVKQQQSVASNRSFSSAPLAEGAALPRTPSVDDRGAPAWMFWSAAGVTAAVATASIVSAFDTLHRHDAYLADATEDRYYSGISSQRRTNLLFLGTGVAAALTVGLAFFTDWEGETTTVAPQLSLSGPGGGLSLHHRF